MQVTLDGCVVLDLRIRLLQGILGLDKIWIAWSEVYRIEDYNGLVIWKEGKAKSGLMNVEPSGLVVASPEDDREKHGMR